MESEMVCHLFPIKEETLELTWDINPEMIKKESIYDTAEDGLMDTSRNGEMSVALFAIKNETDPLEINTETIKRERIDDAHNGFSTGSFALPIGTINTVQPDAFMIKKSNKKKAAKNGQDEKEDHSSSQVVSNKKHRNDKGCSRFTSYMLWSRDKRQQLLATHPELDFVSISREISKMWSKVPTNEKYNWKRRAKRYNDKAKARDEAVRMHCIADHNSAESDQWTIIEVAEAPVSNRQTRIEDDVFLEKTKRTTPRDRSKKVLLWNG